MKSLVEYINEASHNWANPSVNKEELKKFDAAKTGLEKLYIGLQIMCYNHQCEMNIYADEAESDGQVSFVVKGGDKVPFLSDLASLFNEIGNCYKSKYGNDIGIDYDIQDKKELEFAKKLNK